MKYAILFRKLIINGIPYYQGYSKAIGEKVFDDQIKIVDGPNKGKVIGPMETMNDYIYLEINKQQYDTIDDGKVYIKLIDNAYQDVGDFSEAADVAKEFYNKYHDFNLIPSFNIDELYKNAKEELNEKLVGQEEPINNILTKICNNQLYFNHFHNNVLLVGPFGTGKSTIKDVLLNNFDPIPVVEISLTGDYGKDSFEMIHKLVVDAYGNRFLAERGIVIVDGLNDLTATEYNEDEDKVIYYMDTLKEIIKSKTVYLKRESDGTYASFDCSNLTFICMIDMNYDYKDENQLFDSSVYYSKVDAKNLYSIGLSSDFINDCFNDEIVYMNDMTKELAIQILNNEEKSPVYKLKEVLEKNNRKLEIKDGFIEELVEFGLEEGEGFGGILKIFKFLVESKGYQEKK